MTGTWKGLLSFSVVLLNYAENSNNKPTFIKHLFYARHYTKHLYLLTYLKFRTTL